jgi:hypothetical protein
MHRRALSSRTGLANSAEGSWRGFLPRRRRSLLRRRRGHLAPDPHGSEVPIRPFDCTGMPAAGLTFSASKADAQSTLAYVVNNLPDKTATRTDTSGAGLFENVPTGVTTVTATVQNCEALP